MNETPAILIQFDPETWKPTAVYFKASTDVETERLQEILRKGVMTEMLEAARGRNDA